jgi:hypothetical protein
MRAFHQPGRLRRLRPPSPTDPNRLSDNHTDPFSTSHLTADPPRHPQSIRSTPLHASTNTVLPGHPCATHLCASPLCAHVSLYMSTRSMPSAKKSLAHELQLETSLPCASLLAARFQLTTTTTRRASDLRSPSASRASQTTRRLLVVFRPRSPTETAAFQ